VRNFASIAPPVELITTRISQHPLSLFVFILCLQQDSPNFFSPEDHISYYTTVRGPDILCNVIVSGYAAFHQINNFFVNESFFHCWQNSFAGQ